MIVFARNLKKRKTAQRNVNPMTIFVYVITIKKYVNQRIITIYFVIVLIILRMAYKVNVEKNFTNVTYLKLNNYVNNKKTKI